MRKVTKIATLTLATIAASFALQSCGADGDHPGYEFMPNMYRSASYETYSENPVFENRRQDHGEGGDEQHHEVLLGR